MNRETDVLVKLNIDWDEQTKEDIQLANFIINDICDDKNELIIKLANDLIEECNSLNINPIDGEIKQIEKGK